MHPPCTRLFGGGCKCTHLMHPPYEKLNCINSVHPRQQKPKCRLVLRLLSSKLEMQNFTDRVSDLSGSAPRRKFDKHLSYAQTCSTSCHLDHKGSTEMIQSLSNLLIFPMKNPLLYKKKRDRWVHFALSPISLFCFMGLLPETGTTKCTTF